MKVTKVLPFLAVVIMLSVSACSAAPSALAAPAAIISSAKAVLNSPQAASAPVASAPVAAAPVSVSSQAAANVDELQSAYEAVYQKVNPSVVTITISGQASTGRFGFGGQGSQNGQGQVVPIAEGSGFVWDTAGHIVTNNHVVEGAQKITVTFSDGSSYDAKVNGTDPNADLAVIQVTNAPASLLKPVTVGDSTQVKVGEMVVAIGNPFGLSNTMTTGIVSAISRTIPAGASSSQNSNAPSFSIPDAIQTDAAINPGNSGGVLVNMNGELVGVPSQIESNSGSNSGVGFAIPAAAVKRVVPQLISSGKAAHSYLGISGATLTSDMASTLGVNGNQQGVLVASVVSGGPASQAGLRGANADANGNPTSAGDIITGIDGKTITTMDQLISYLSNNTQPGQTVTLTVQRGSQTAQVKVTLGTQPTQ